MKVKFVNRKGEQTASTLGYAEKKIAKLDRLFRSDAEAVVTFTSQKKNIVKVEVTVNASGNLYRGESATTDVKASIDAAISAIEGQVRKYKTRLAKRLRDDIPPVSPVDDTPEVKEEEITIIRTKTFAIKPMSVEEAVLQMNLTGHNFYVFRNADHHDTVAVVYSRNDGGYGLIEDGDSEQ